MIGAATESMILELRDVLIQRLEELGLPVSTKLRDWKIKRILEGISTELNSRRNQMPSGLSELVEQYWPAFTGQIRKTRNDAGHPTNIEPVTFETVQASLLIFPELASLSSNLKNWILNDYS